VIERIGVDQDERGTIAGRLVPDVDAITVEEGHCVILVFAA